MSGRPNRARSKIQFRTRPTALGGPDGSFVRQPYSVSRPTTRFITSITRMTRLLVRACVFVLPTSVALQCANVQSCPEIFRSTDLQSGLFASFELTGFD